MLYRTNAQSRSFEEALRARGMRYRMLGGFSFYQRAEVKDALAYVRLAMFPDDDVALLRVLNTPPRGIGKTSIDSLRAVARENGSLAVGGPRQDASKPAAAAPSRRCAAFRELIEDLRASKLNSAARGISSQPCSTRTGYLDMLRAARHRRRHRPRSKTCANSSTPWPKAPNAAKR